MPDQTAYMLSAMARADYLSGNTTFQEVVLNSIGANFKANPTILTYVPEFCVKWCSLEAETLSHALTEWVPFVSEMPGL